LTTDSEGVYVHEEHDTSQYVEVLLELPHLLGAHVADLLHDLMLPAEHLHDGHSLGMHVRGEAGVKLLQGGVGGLSPNLDHFGELLYPLVAQLHHVLRRPLLPSGVEVNNRSNADTRKAIGGGFGVNLDMK
jgi:hypothetical protein